LVEVGFGGVLNPSEAESPLLITNMTLIRATTHACLGQLLKSICSGARVSSISSISSRGDGLDPNLLYPPLEEEGPPLFSHLSQK
jgi:hypothetical protein